MDPAGRTSAPAPSGPVGAVPGVFPRCPSACRTGSSGEFGPYQGGREPRQVLGGDEAGEAGRRLREPQRGGGIAGAAVEGGAQFGPHALGLAAEDVRSDRSDPRDLLKELTDPAGIPVGGVAEPAKVPAVPGQEELRPLPQRGGGARPRPGPCGCARRHPLRP